MPFFPINNYSKQCFVELVSVSRKHEGPLSLCNSPCMFHWKSEAFLFLFSVFLKCPSYTTNSIFLFIMTWVHRLNRVFTFNSYWYCEKGTFRNMQTTMTQISQRICAVRSQFYFSHIQIKTLSNLKFKRRRLLSFRSYAGWQLFYRMHMP